MTQYLTEEQERQLSIVILAIGRRETLGTLADALDNKADYIEERDSLRAKSEAYDLIYREAIASLTGKDPESFNPYETAGEEIEKRLGLEE